VLMMLTIYYYNGFKDPVRNPYSILCSSYFAFDSETQHVGRRYYLLGHVQSLSVDFGAYFDLHQLNLQNINHLLAFQGYS